MNDLQKKLRASRPQMESRHRTEQARGHSCNHCPSSDTWYASIISLAIFRLHKPSIFGIGEYRGSNTSGTMNSPVSGRREVYSCTTLTQLAIDATSQLTYVTFSTGKRKPISQPNPYLFLIKWGTGKTAVRSPSQAPCHPTLDSRRVQCG